MPLDTLTHEINDRFGTKTKTLAIILLTIGILLTTLSLSLYLTPEKSTQTITTDTSTINTTTTTKAVATQDTQLYKNGQTIHNSSLYYLDSMPNPTITSTTTLPDGMTGNQTLSLVISAAYQNNTYYTNTLVLDQANGTGSITTSNTINIASVNRQLLNIRAESGGKATATATFVTTTNYNSNTYSGTTKTRLPTTFFKNVYTIGDGKETTITTERTTTEKTLTEHSLFITPFAMLSLISLLIGSVFAYTHRVTPIPNTPFDQTLTAYTDWWSNGSLPETHDYNSIELETAQGVFDIAIDNHARVIYDEHEQTLFTIDTNTLYYTTN